MQRPSLAFTLLAVFTSAERAAEIEGDLIEQSCTFGKGWMRKQALLVALSLAGRAMTRNLASIFLLCVPALAAIYLSVMVSEWVFVGPVGSFFLRELAFPQNAARLAVLCLVIPPSAFLIGAALVRLAPVLGVRAGVAVALAFSLVRVVMHLVAVGGASTIAVVAMKIGIEIGLMAAPLLWGSISSHRRALVRVSADRDPHSN
jgi:hypothetical protein